MNVLGNALLQLRDDCLIRHLGQGLLKLALHLLISLLRYLLRSRLVLQFSIPELILESKLDLPPLPFNIHL